MCNAGYAATSSVAAVAPKLLFHWPKKLSCNRCESEIASPKRPIENVLGVPVVRSEIVRPLGLEGSVNQE